MSYRQRNCWVAAAVQWSGFTEVLRRFPPEELADMRGDDGLITVDCEFCSSEYKVAL